MVTMIPAPTATPTPGQYHSAQGVWSSSRRKLFDSDPGKAFGMYVAQPRLYAPAPPESWQVIGSAVHAIVAHAGGQPDLIHEAPTKSRDDHWRAARYHYPDRLVVTRRELEDAKRAADAVLEPRTESAEIALAMLTGPGGYSEWFHEWDEPVSGEDGYPRSVPCQQLLDRFAPVGGRPAIIEVKSVGDPADVAPDRFCWVARRFGYDDQLAWNLRGASRALGGVEPLGYLVAIGTRPSCPVSITRAGGWLLGLTEEQIEKRLQTDPDADEFELRKLGTQGRRGRLKARAALDVSFERLAWCLEDPTGARWCHAYERLEDGRIPELGN